MPFTRLVFTRVEVELFPFYFSLRRVRAPWLPSPSAIREFLPVFREMRKLSLFRNICRETRVGLEPVLSRQGPKPTHGRALPLRIPAPEGDRSKNGAVQSPTLLLWRLDGPPARPRTQEPRCLAFHRGYLAAVRPASKNGLTLIAEGRLPPLAIA